MLSAIAIPNEKEDFPSDISRIAEPSTAPSTPCACRQNTLSPLGRRRKDVPGNALPLDETAIKDPEQLITPSNLR